MRAIGRDPIFVERAEGAELYRRRRQPLRRLRLLVGAADPRARAPGGPRGGRRGRGGAARRSARRPRARSSSPSWSPRRVPRVDMLRMTSSGTEAAMSAIRLARAATGRDKLLKFAGAYHGHVDGLLAEAGSGLATAGDPRLARACPAAATANTVIVPWNDPEAVRRALAEHEFAAVLASPTPPTWASSRRERASSSCCATRRDRQRRAARLRRGHLRLPGRARRRQELTGVLPDLTVMGKVVGGGLPAAAYGGSVELMERIAPAGDVYQAGTLCGNPLAVAAALARSSCSTTTPTRG